MRRLRDQRGLTQEQVMERTGISRTTLFRVENARGKPHRHLMNALLDLYEVSDSKRSELLSLHRSADQRGWWTRYGLQGEYPAYIGFEANAVAVANYEGQVVPGLLQTADYARALMSGGRQPVDEAGVQKRLEARMRRQELLRRDGPFALTTVIDEAALHREVGGRAVMRAQLKRLLADQGLHSVDLRVLPFAAGAHASTAGSFTILDFEPPDTSLVYVEHAAGDVFLDSADDIVGFRKTFDQLVSKALDPTASAVLLESILKGYDR